MRYEGELAVLADTGMCSNVLDDIDLADANLVMLVLKTGTRWHEVYCVTLEG